MAQDSPLEEITGLHRNYAGEHRLYHSVLLIGQGCPDRSSSESDTLSAYGVAMAIPRGCVPAAKGDPESGVRPPVVPLIWKAVTPFSVGSTTYRYFPAVSTTTWYG